MLYSYIRSDNLIIRGTPTPVSCRVKNIIYLTDYANIITRCLDFVGWILWVGFCCLDFIWCLDFSFVSHAVDI